MPKLKINTDAYVYTVPNPVSGQAPVPRTARRGEIVDFSTAEAERGQSLVVTNHYPDPGGSPATVSRKEPALVDPDAKTAEKTLKERADADARIAELEAEVAKLRAERPPVASTETPGEALPVTLTPAQTGVRELPAVDAEAEAKAAKSAKK